MARKKTVPKNVISLDGIRHDEIDHAAALVLMAEAKTEKKGGLAISLEQLLKAVQALLIALKVSGSDINRRIKRWAEQGWVQKTEEDIICSTEKGLPYINLMANAA